MIVLIVMKTGASESPYRNVRIRNPETETLVPRPIHPRVMGEGLDRRGRVRGMVGLFFGHGFGKSDSVGYIVSNAE